MLNNQRITEAMLSAPASLAGDGSVTSAWADMNNRYDYTFLVAVGAMAASKGVKLELLGSNDSGGGGAETIRELSHTADSGGETGRLFAVRGRVTPDWRYLAVKLTNLDDTTATVAAVMLVSDTLYVPDDGGVTVLQV